MPNSNDNAQQLNSENAKFEACFDKGYEAAMDYAEYRPPYETIDENDAWRDGWNQAQDELDDEFDEEWEEDSGNWEDEEDDYDDEEYDDLDDEDWDNDSEELETV